VPYSLQTLSPDRHNTSTVTSDIVILSELRLPHFEALTLPLIFLKRKYATFINDYNMPSLSTIIIN